MCSDKGQNISSLSSVQCKNCSGRCTVTGIRSLISVSISVTDVVIVFGDHQICTQTRIKESSHSVTLTATLLILSTYLLLVSFFFPGTHSGFPGDSMCHKQVTSKRRDHRH